MPFPEPHPAQTTCDVRDFFDAFAQSNYERHGPARRLLQYRASLLRRYADLRPGDAVLDLGCGDGSHLRVLSETVRTGIGIDLAPGMIREARREAGSLTFRVDDAEHCRTVDDCSVDAVVCVGVIEHVLRPRAVFRQIRRVLRPGGRFAVLTLNGAFWWYALADRLGLPTRHLTTDARLSPTEARTLLREAGLGGRVGHWSFAPCGDVPRPVAALLRASNALGRRLQVPALQGGMVLYGTAPGVRSPASGTLENGTLENGTLENGMRENSILEEGTSTNGAPDHSWQAATNRRADASQVGND
jgi:SAM-dependent methyltransferase